MNFNMDEDRPERWHVEEYEGRDASARFISLRGDDEGDVFARGEAEEVLIHDTDNVRDMVENVVCRTLLILDNHYFHATYDDAGASEEF